MPRSDPVARPSRLKGSVIIFLGSHRSSRSHFMLRGDRRFSVKLLRRRLMVASFKLGKTMARTEIVAPRWQSRDEGLRTERRRIAGAADRKKNDERLTVAKRDRSGKGRRESPSREHPSALTTEMALATDAFRREETRALYNRICANVGKQRQNRPNFFSNRENNRRPTA